MGPSNPAEPHKSWKKINEERKALKKKRKQEKLLKSLEQEAKAEAESKTNRLKVAKENPSTVTVIYYFAM